MRRALSFLCAIGAVLSLASPALAQYPPGAARLQLSDTTVVCGQQSIAISGRGFTPGEPVRISFDDQQVASVTVNAQGSFSTTVATPAAASGVVDVIATQGTVSASAVLNCVAGAGFRRGAGAAGAGFGQFGGLAFTGAQIATSLLMLAVLAGGGLAAIRAGRRRLRAGSE